MNTVLDLLMKYQTCDQDMSQITVGEMHDYKEMAENMCWDAFRVSSRSLTSFLNNCHEEYEKALRYMIEYHEYSVEGKSVRRGISADLSVFPKDIELTLQRYVTWIACGSRQKERTIVPVANSKPNVITVRWKQQEVYDTCVEWLDGSKEVKWVELQAFLNSLLNCDEVKEITISKE